MTDKIEREISIQAPIATVWEVITKPEYISQWFGSLTEDGAETKVCFTESGFEKLEITAEQKANLIDKHTPGWGDFLSSLQRCAQNISTKA